MFLCKAAKKKCECVYVLLFFRQLLLVLHDMYTVTFRRVFSEEEGHN